MSPEPCLTPETPISPAPTPTTITSRCLQALQKIVRDLMTGKDNTSHDLGKYSWVICTIAIIGGWYWQLVHKAPNMNIKDLAIALAGNTASHGIAIGMKGSTEPNPR